MKTFIFFAVTYWTCFMSWIIRNTYILYQITYYLYWYSLSIFKLLNNWCIRNNMQKQPPEVFYKKVVLKNFTKFTGKTCAEVFFLIKLQPCGLTEVFSCEFCECLKTPFFTGHLPATTFKYGIKRWRFETNILSS